MSGDDTIRPEVEFVLAELAQDHPEDVWKAMTNVLWVPVDSPITVYDTETYSSGISWSFRQAGKLVAKWRGEGNYMDWYCCGHSAVVTPEISDALAVVGVRPVVE